MNQKQLVVGLTMYTDDHDGWIVPGSVSVPPGFGCPGYEVGGHLRLPADFSLLYNDNGSCGNDIRLDYVGFGVLYPMQLHYADDEGDLTGRLFDRTIHDLP